MAAARFSNDVLDMFYRPIAQEVNRRQKRPIAPARVAHETYIDFELNINNFHGWLCLWKMNVPKCYPYRSSLLQFWQKTKTRLTNLIENEIGSVGSVKTQFWSHGKSLIVRDEEV